MTMYCEYPAYLKQGSCQANVDAGFEGVMGVQDLNFRLRISDTWGCRGPGATNERGIVCANHGADPGQPNSPVM